MGGWGMGNFKAIYVADADYFGLVLLSIACLLGWKRCRNGYISLNTFLYKVSLS